MNSCLLDKNVLLDLLESRPRFKKIIQLLPNYSKVYISTSTFLTLTYLSRKLGFNKKIIQTFLNQFQLLEIQSQDCLKALQKSTNLDEVEDFAELELAERNHLVFLTADKLLFNSQNSSQKMILVD